LNNGEIQKQTDTFLWCDIVSGAGKNWVKMLYGKDKFDLYTDFENVKKWFLENGGYWFHAAYGFGFRDEKFFNEQKNNIENFKLKDDEYIIGVHYYFSVPGFDDYRKRATYLLVGSNFDRKTEVLFYTNYGNILSIKFRTDRVNGDWYIIESIKTHFYNRKLDTIYINHLNLTINADTNFESLIAMLSDIYGIVDYKKEDERRRYEENEERRRDDERNEETNKRNEETKKRNEERIELCKEYKKILKDQNITDGPSMAIWVRGKDRKSEIFTKIMKAYKFVFENNNCKDIPDGENKKSKRKSMKKKSKRKMKKKSKRKNL
jgi:hypothetical protein